MYIVIGGGGVAGSTLAKALVDLKHDVVVIEPDKDSCEALYAETGAVTINGSATEMRTLREAGMDRADAAVACMYRDSDNMSFSLLARSLGVPHIIAKMRDPNYRVAFEAAGVNYICDIIAMLKTEVLADLHQAMEVKSI